MKYFPKQFKKDLIYSGTYPVVSCVMFSHFLVVIFGVKVVTSIDYEEMEPVIQIELNEENVGEEDVRREAVQYVQDNYKDIEKKMKGHKKGEDNLFYICSSIQGLKPD